MATSVAVSVNTWGCGSTDSKRTTGGATPSGVRRACTGPVAGVTARVSRVLPFSLGSSSARRWAVTGLLQYLAGGLHRAPSPMSPTYGATTEGSLWMPAAVRNAPVSDHNT